MPTRGADRNVGFDPDEDREFTGGGNLSGGGSSSGNVSGTLPGVNIRDLISAGSPSQIDGLLISDGEFEYDIGFIAGSLSPTQIANSSFPESVKQAAISVAQAGGGHNGLVGGPGGATGIAQTTPNISNPSARAAFEKFIRDNGAYPDISVLTALVAEHFPTAQEALAWAREVLLFKNGVPRLVGPVGLPAVNPPLVPGPGQQAVDTTIPGVTPTGAGADTTAQARTDNIVDQVMPFISSNELLPENRQDLLGFIETFTGATAAEAGAAIDQLALLQNETFQLQSARDSRLRGVENAFGRPQGTFGPAGSNALNSLFNQFQAARPITGFNTSVDPGNQFTNFLQGGGVTRAGLNNQLNSILSDVRSDLASPTGIGESSPFFSLRFGDPNAALQAGIQPFLAGVSARDRAGLSNIIQDTFGSQFATNPLAFESPQQILGIFEQLQQSGFLT